MTHPSDLRQTATTCPSPSSTRAVAAVLLLCVWTVFELRTKTPLGSAIGGLVLAAGTDTGRLFPNDDAYTAAALAGVAAMAVTTLTSLILARRRSPETNPITAPSG